MAFRFPMTPAQAAILGRPPPAAVVAQSPAMMQGLPMSPAQAAILGQQAQYQQPPIAGAGGMAPGPLNLGVGMDPMATLLLARGNRDEPIETGIGLLGRLAALGVGSHLTRQNERDAREQALEFVDSRGDPEAAGIARYAILSGAKPSDVIGSLLTLRGQNVTRAEGQDDRSVTMRGQDISGTVTMRGQDITRGIAEANIGLDRELGNARIGLERAMLGETRRSNQATEGIARDRLAYEEARDDADRMVELAAGKGGTMTAEAGKALSNAMNATPAAELLDAPDLAYYQLDKLGVNYVQALIASGADNVVTAGIKLLRGGQYEQMPEQTKRMLLHGLTVLDAAARDVSGAALTSADLAIKGQQVFNMPGESRQIMNEKRSIRRTMIDAMLAKVPAAFLPPSLMSDEQLDAIARGQQ